MGAIRRKVCGDCCGVRRLYIHDDPDWPNLRWDEGVLAELLADVRHRQGRLIGRMEALGFDLRQEAVLETLTGDVVKRSEIEGERLDRGIDRGDR